MRVFATLSLVVTTLIALAGCGGGGGIEPDKTIAHDGGILNVGNVKSVSPKLEARAGQGDWTDLTAMSNNDLEAWMKGKDSAEARSYIQFDDSQLPLETRTVNNAGQLKSMKSDLDSRMSAVNKFMTNNSKQLNAPGW